MVRKTTTKEDGPRRTAGGKRAKGGRKQRGRKKARSVTPRWVVPAVGTFLVVGLLAAFYGLFVRPYTYRWKTCEGVRVYGACVPQGYAVHGIDISHYQGDVRWDMLNSTRQKPEAPLRFVFMKATEGGDLADETFGRNFAQAREHGFVRGAYHYFIPTTPADQQARFFMQTVPLTSGDLPPVLDVEAAPKRRNAQAFRQNVKSWLDLVEAHYGVKPIIYTSPKFRERWLNDTLFDSYPHWIAHYYVDSVRYGGQWHFWQHTDAGVVPGVDEAVDLNVFNGSEEQLQALTIP